MSCIALANMKKGVLLHKVILVELILAYGQGINLFWNAPVYGWYLSTASVFLYLSNSLHNVIAWMKLRPFLDRRASAFFLGTIALVQPYWILEMYANFAYFNGINENLFPKTRPIEALFRDPWWIAACAKLLWTIRSQYSLTLVQTVTASPRFAIMLVSMLLSLVFVVLDILSAVGALSGGSSGGISGGGVGGGGGGGGMPSVLLPLGVNPFWKLALVFKCLTDTIVLDDFKTALDRLWTFKISSWAPEPGHGPSDLGATHAAAKKSHGGGGGGGLAPTSLELSERNLSLV
ncbi:hypothetical protein GGR56DRAFT_88699 [Xylariaceae sp. FL0804]|nr:hypothetical protein GGR56DRAFT_88699 [Xylariaceae sp. FL0804]